MDTEAGTGIILRFVCYSQMKARASEARQFLILRTAVDLLAFCEEHIMN
jgi:hypothetical protein